MRLVLLGYGSVGSCVIDCLLATRPAWLALDHIVIVDKLPQTARLRNLPSHVRVFQQHITKKNYKAVFEALQIGPADIVIDLLSGAGTMDIIKETSIVRGGRYLSSSLDQWDYNVGTLASAVRKALLFRKKTRWHFGKPTVLLTHGMNPGLVSHFAFIGMSRLPVSERGRIERVHITEIDSQHPINDQAAPDAWSKEVMPHVKGFGGRRQTVERPVWTTWAPQNFFFEMNSYPSLGRGSKVVYTKKPAIRQWVPSRIKNGNGLMDYHGMTVDHEEVFTLQHFMRKAGFRGPNTDYRFVYVPCPLGLKSLFTAGELARLASEGKLPLGDYIKRLARPSPPLVSRDTSKPGRLLSGPLEGSDIVGTCIDTPLTSVWVGNTCPGNFLPHTALAGMGHNATCFQVAAGIISGLWYLVQYPQQGILFPEEITAEARTGLLQVAEQYMGPVEIISKAKGGI